MLSNSNATYSKISHPPETTIEERDFEPKAPFHHNDTWIWEAMGDCLPDTDIQIFTEGPPFRPVGKRKGGDEKLVRVCFKWNIGHEEASRNPIAMRGKCTAKNVFETCSLSSLSTPINRS